MNRKLWLLVDGALLGVIVAYAFPARAADVLQPVTDAASGFPWWLVILGVAAVIIAGLIIWHRRNPTAEAAALVEAHAGLTHVAADLRDLVESLLAKHAEPAPPAPPPAPTPEQLAAVDAAKSAYNNARTAAGLPEIPS